MARYAAFLRGVSPMNLKMADLARVCETAGFTDVKTVLSSGNVVFTARATKSTSIERRAEAAMQDALGRTFMTIVRSIDELDALLAADPYAPFRVRPKTKRVVTLLRGAPKTTLVLPMKHVDADIWTMGDRSVFSTYLPGPNGGAFMAVLERALGKDVTTRTWETLEKVIRAGRS